MTNGTLTEYGPVLRADGFPDALALWDALLAHFLERRPIRFAFMTIYPETTVRDVQQVAGLLAAEVMKLPADALGRADTVAKWSAYRNEIQRQAAGLRSLEVFPDNEQFWTEKSKRLALDVSTSAGLPTKGEIVLDAVRGGMGLAPIGTTATVKTDGAFDAVVGVVEDFVDATKGVAGDAAGVVKDVAGGAKDLVKDVVTGASDAVVAPLVSAVGKPLLIGAAVVGGLFLLPKLVESTKTRRAA